MELPIATHYGPRVEYHYHCREAADATNFIERFMAAKLPPAKRLFGRFATILRIRYAD